DLARSGCKLLALDVCDEESLEVDERQRLELKRLLGPPRSRNSRTRRSGTGRRSTRRPSALYRGGANVDDGG
ncbi:MAG TPA: hypothetical protein VG476_03250, partial [Acidimicrobiales bacterium]|nr:hypothetical protein [Acidimicrobiales bacterium]